jgi:hypothetical protein
MDNCDLPVVDDTLLGYTKGEELFIVDDSEAARHPENFNPNHVPQGRESSMYFTCDLIAMLVRLVVPLPDKQLAIPTSEKIRRFLLNRTMSDPSTVLNLNEAQLISHYSWWMSGNGKEGPEKTQLRDLLKARLLELDRLNVQP